VVRIFTWLFDQFVMLMVIFFSGFMQLTAGWKGPGDIVGSLNSDSCSPTMTRFSVLTSRIMLVSLPPIDMVMHPKIFSTHALIGDLKRFNSLLALFGG